MNAPPLTQWEVYGMLASLIATDGDHRWASEMETESNLAAMALENDKHWKHDDSCPLCSFMSGDEQMQKVSDRPVEQPDTDRDTGPTDHNPKEHGSA